MADTNQVPPWEEIAKRVEEALNDDTHEFWDRFGKSWGEDDTMDDIQQQIQVEDDRKRKEDGLEPRSWEEIEKDMEQSSARTLETFDEDLMKWDTEQRKAEGLEPRSKEEMEEDLMPQIGGVVLEVLYKYDTKKRKEKGLGPRPMEEFEEHLKDGFETLGEP